MNSTDFFFQKARSAFIYIYILSVFLSGSKHENISVQICENRELTEDCVLYRLLPSTGQNKNTMLNAGNPCSFYNTF